MLYPSGMAQNCCLPLTAEAGSSRRTALSRRSGLDCLRLSPNTAYASCDTCSQQYRLARMDTHNTGETFSSRTFFVRYAGSRGVCYYRCLGGGWDGGVVQNSHPSGGSLVPNPGQREKGVSQNTESSVAKNRVSVGMQRVVIRSNGRAAGMTKCIA